MNSLCTWTGGACVFKNPVSYPSCNPIDFLGCTSTGYNTARWTGGVSCYFSQNCGINSYCDDSSGCEPCARNTQKNCNQIASDGCETPINTVTNCGSCGNVCGANQNCVNGQCQNIACSSYGTVSYKDGMYVVANGGCYNYICDNTPGNNKVYAVTYSSPTTMCDSKQGGELNNRNCYCEGSCNTNAEMTCDAPDNYYCTGVCQTSQYCSSWICPKITLSDISVNNREFINGESFDAKPLNSLEQFALWNGSGTGCVYECGSWTTSYVCSGSISPICSGTCYSGTHGYGVKLYDVSSGNYNIYTCGASDGICPNNYGSSCGISSGICASHGISDPDCTRCGDGSLQWPNAYGVYEQCDGSVINLDEGYSCDYFTTLFNNADWNLNHGTPGCNGNCQITLGSCSLCMNNIVEGSEQCDGSNLGGYSCDEFTTLFNNAYWNLNHGTPSCTNCALTKGTCSLCMNNIIEGTEECDKTNIGSHTCSEYSIVYNNVDRDMNHGTPSCSSTCAITRGTCSYCGNNAVEGTETCDGTNPGSHTCSEFYGGKSAAGTNYYGAYIGVPTCSSDCNSITGQGTCQSCGDGRVQGAEECDDGNSEDFADACSNACKKIDCKIEGVTLTGGNRCNIIPGVTNSAYGAVYSCDTNGAIGITVDYHGPATTCQDLVSNLQVDIGSVDDPDFKISYDGEMFAGGNHRVKDGATVDGNQRGSITYSVSLSPGETTEHFVANRLYAMQAAFRDGLPGSGVFRSNIWYGSSGNYKIIIDTCNNAATTYNQYGAVLKGFTEWPSLLVNQLGAGGVICNNYKIGRPLSNSKQTYSTSNDLLKLYNGDNNRYPVCGDSFTLKQFCSYLGYGDAIVGVKIGVGTPCLSYVGGQNLKYGADINSVTCVGSGAVTAVSPKVSAIDNKTTRSTAQLNICADQKSLLKYCKSTGVANVKYSVEGEYGYCARWNGKEWIKASSERSFVLQVTCSPPSDLAIVYPDATVEDRACSINMDGFCPDDFSSTPICAKVNGTSADPDCGIHQFPDTTKIIDADGIDRERTTTDSVILDPNKINAALCNIEHGVSSKMKLHAECVNGTIVQDNVTGCPVCLKEGQTMTYDLGVNKYVAISGGEFKKIKEVLTLKGQGDKGGIYPACPDKKYDYYSSSDSCKPSPVKCDEGYRSIMNNLVASNNLTKKCDQPAIFNKTTNKWQFKTDCLYPLQNFPSIATQLCGTNALCKSKFTNYCGLNSWYNNYEIYDDQFNLSVK
jgi:cysteine-rich repeat protein